VTRFGESSPIGLLLTSGSLFKNKEVARIFGQLFFHVKICVLIRTKKRWATLWAIFFTNSTGHTEYQFGNAPGDSTVAPGNWQSCQLKKATFRPWVAAVLQKGSANFHLPRSKNTSTQFHKFQQQKGFII
jgi:hypothetical protein